MEVRKTVTVLFADVTGSTSLGERLDPEAIRGVMTRYFDQTRAAVEAHGGTVEKFIGDAVMAVFGVPIVHEDDALRALRAAAQMREAFAALNAELERDWGARIAVRTGVNTGKVVAGDPSTGQTFVTGDAVNVAARLEQTAEPGEILLGEETHRLVRDAVRVEPVEPLELKGKAERVPAWRLLEVTPGAPAFARRLDSPLVGRDEELGRLRKVFEEAVADPACRVATIVGDAGAGKSRLATELAATVGDRARTLWGRCLPYGEGITFWPIAEVVRDAAGIGETESPQQARAKVSALSAGAEDGHMVADRVAAAIGLGETAGGDLRETFWAIRRLLEELALDIPLVLVIEDVHWAEPTFLDLLRYVAGFSRDRPILLLCTARPDLRERQPDWVAVGETVALAPLTQEESERLIENLLGRVGLSGDVRDRITDAAEGNPLYVEELLRMLIDEGYLERTNGHWTARGDLSRVSVPGTIGALLSARLDQLEGGERAVIQRASVVGRVFWWGAVTDLSPEDDRPDVGSHLQTLLRKELVRPDRSGFAGEDAFRFSHILVRDASYDSMPKRARAELHERFASWLERKAGDRITEFEEILGYHLEQAYRYRTELGPADDAGRAVGERAARHLAAAAPRAMAQSDFAATANLLSRAVDLMPPDHPRRLQMLVDLGLALSRSDIVRADAVLTEAVETARAAGDRRVEARAGTTRAFVRLLLDPNVSQADSLGEVEGYAAVLEEVGDDAGVADALTLIGSISFWQGQAAVSVERFERALDHARRVQDRRATFSALRWLALPTSEGPTPASDGVRRLDWILEQAGGDRSVEMAVSRARAVFEAMAGRFDEARAMIARGKALATEIGDQLSVAALLREGGAIELGAGDAAAAERELRAAYEILDSRQDFGHLSSTAPDLGEALIELGRAEEALQISEYTETISIEGDVDANVRWRQLRARALARLGRHDEAEPFALEAVRMISATDYLDLHAHALMALAEVRRLAGRTSEAAEVVREGIQLYRRKENVVGERRAVLMLEELGL